MKYAKNYIKKYCTVRTFSAGVFAGYLIELDGTQAILSNARRIWKWAGALTLSELAMNGTTKPNECNFAMPVNKVILTEVIEIIPCTQKGKKSIQSVKEWQL